MNDYNLTIKKNNQVMCTVGGHNVNYDNYLWWQLEKLINIVESGFDSKEDLISKIESNTEYFRESDEEYEDNPVLDLDNMTIDMPVFPVYKQEEVSPEECCINLKTIDGELYADYGDDEVYLMDHVSFDDVSLLTKKNVSIEEFKKVCRFVSSIIEDDKTDFVLNESLIIRFNNM